MLFQIQNTSLGYIVSVLHEYHWYPLINFGDNHGDAIFFKHHVCPNLDSSQLRSLAAKYDSSSIFSLSIVLRSIKRP